MKGRLWAATTGAPALFVLAMFALAGCADPVNESASLVSVDDGVEIGVWGGRCARIDEVATRFLPTAGGDVFEIHIDGRWSPGNDCALGVVESFPQSFTPSASVAVSGLVNADFGVCDGTDDLAAGMRLCTVD